MPEAQQSKKRKLLFVDAESLLREVYSADAERAGFEALVAGNSRDALRLFARKQPDAVVVDLDIGGDIDGPDLLRRLRASDLGRIIPIVGVSAGTKAIRSVTDAVIAHDVDDYLTKPVHGERLLWRLQELIEGRPLGVVKPGGGEQMSHEPRPVLLSRTTDFLQGTLAQTDIATLFFSFFATGRSGKLCAMRDKEVSQVWFRRGVPIFAESTVPGRDFGDSLVACGLLEAGELAAAREEWLEIDRSLGTVLVARGSMRARQLFEAMRENVDAIINDLFRWDDGSYWMEYLHDPSTNDAPDAVSLGHGPTHYVMNGLRNHYDRARCEGIIGAAAGRLVTARAAHFVLRELDDPYYYENMLAQLGEGISAADLLSRHPFDRDEEALAALTALWVVGGVLEVDDRVKRRKAQKEVRRKVAAERIREAVATAAGEHPDAKAARQARIRERLRKRKEQKARGGVASIMASLDKVSAEVAYENGLRLLNLREYPRAAETLAAAVKMSPHNVSYCSSYAQAVIGQARPGPEELDYALRLMKKAVSIDPDHGEPYHWLGMILLRMGHREEAKITLRRAVELGSSMVHQSRSVYEGL